MTVSNIPFFFDFISPYAYLAWRDLRDAGDAVEPVPVVFGVLLDHHGNVGPAEVPAKRRYVFVDCIRKAHRRSVPFAPPPSHPFNPLLALRLCLSPLVVDKGPLIDALFGVAWGGERHDEGGLESPVVVERVLEKLGLDAAVVLEDATTAEGKARLKATTERAIDHGVFGVPTVLVDGEIFWGTGSLAFARDRIKGHDPVDDVELSRWANLPQTAKRKRAPS